MAAGDSLLDFNAPAGDGEAVDRSLATGQSERRSSARGPIVDGFADELTTALAQIHDLFVIARNSAFAYRGKSCDMRRIAKELGVRNIIEGSVQRSGDAVERPAATSGPRLSTVPSPIIWRFRTRWRRALPMRIR